MSAALLLLPDFALIFPGAVLKRYSAGTVLSVITPPLWIVAAR